MEENIKTLEEYLKECEGKIFNGSEVFGTELYRSIEHLISAYKKLEEENKELTLFKQMALYRLDVIEPRELISKQVIRDKIEEFFDNEKWLVEHDLRALCDDEKEARSYYLNKRDILNVLSVKIQELLEERNK